MLHLSKKLSKLIIGVCVYGRVYMYESVCVYTWRCMLVCICVCVSGHECVYAFICACVSMYASVCVRARSCLFLPFVFIRIMTTLNSTDYCEIIFYNNYHLIISGVKPFYYFDLS